MPKPTQPVTLRALEPDDLAGFIELRGQPRAYANTLGTPHPRAAQWKNRLENPAEGARHIVAIVGGKLVGCASLRVHTERRAHVGDIGISVHDAYTGQGVGRILLTAILDLADNWLALRRLELTVFADNAPAIALYESVGFEREGYLRAYAFRNGAYADALTMARVRL